MKTSQIKKNFYNFQKRLGDLNLNNIDDIEFTAFLSSVRALYDPKIKNTIKKSFLKEAFYFITDLIYCILSIPGIMKACYKKNLIGIWTGDFYNNETKGDFRYGKLYQELKLYNQDFIEFVSPSNEGILRSISIYTQRKRSIIYFQSVSNILSIFNINSYKLSLDGLTDEEFAIYENNYVLIRRVVKFLSILNLKKRIKSFFILEFSSKNSGIYLYNVINSVKQVGCMHGAGIKEYMYYEYFTGINIPDQLCFSRFGVWSSHWKNYYKNNSFFYKDIQVSGSIRNNFLPKKNRLNTHKIIMLIEPLLDLDEISGYENLLEKYKENIVIKLRPDFKKKHLETYYKKFPFLKECEINCESMEIFLEADQYSYVIGSHTTGMIDCMMAGIVPIFLNTKTWGDYFEIKKFNTLCICLSENENFCLLEEPQFQQYSLSAHNIAVELLGSKDGVEWLIKELR